MTVHPIDNIAETIAHLAGYASAEEHKRAMKQMREFYFRTIELAAKIRDEEEK